MGTSGSFTPPGGGSGWPLTADVSAAGFSIEDLASIVLTGALGDSILESDTTYWAISAGLRLHTDVPGDRPSIEVGFSGYGDEPTDLVVLSGTQDQAQVDLWHDDDAGGVAWAQMAAIDNGGVPRSTVFVSTPLNYAQLAAIDLPGINEGSWLELGEAPRLYGTATAPYSGGPGLRLEDPTGGSVASELWSGPHDYGPVEDYSMVALGADAGAVSWVEIDRQVAGAYSYIAMSLGTHPVLSMAKEGDPGADFSVEADVSQWWIPIRDDSNASVGRVLGSSSGPHISFGLDTDDGYIQVWGPDAGGAPYDDSITMYAVGGITLQDSVPQFSPPRLIRFYSDSDGIDGTDAIADVTPGALVLLSDVITTVGEIRTKFNALLAVERDLGVLAT